ncbi:MULTISPECIES: hypothetical protein [Streptomyces]|uniref:Uncharacterized protein n=1 Tax=Streptomyces sudanensis TaxID=436397 RepID=A0ABY4T704_9ACTN|nr:MULTISPECIES: hypothetical protein [Streptomyces]URN14757.1 hypothetical protein MW084_01170 [Streptomyces sudanensis]
MHEEIAEQQADITCLLLHHIQAPLSGDQCVRGVLPAPESAEAVRIAIGPEGAYTPDHLVAYEIPLRTGGDLITGYEIIHTLRALLNSGTQIYPSDRVGTVMGMTLVHVDPGTVGMAPSTPDDNALIILRSLTNPFTEDQPDPRLCGFLFLDKDRLRLYLDTQDAPGVIAADVRPSGAITALLAALPSLVAEEERMTVDSADPHCARVVDLTDW